MEVQRSPYIDAQSWVNFQNFTVYFFPYAVKFIALFLFSFSLRVVFSAFFVMNLVFWVNGSSAAVPFSTLVALLALWFGVSVPLTFIGSYFGFRKRVRYLNASNFF